MSHILICGAAGYTNLGDDAVLCGILSQLNSAAPGRVLRVAGGPQVESLLAGRNTSAVSYEDQAELARAIEDADLVILGGGGLLYDVGYDASLDRFLEDAPDRQWLYEMARLAAAASAAGRPLMLYAMGVGPLLTQAARLVARFTGNQAKAITVRDQASADLLAECRVPRTRAHVAADPAITLEPGGEELAETWLNRCGIGALPRPWVALNLRPWGDEQQRQRLALSAGALARMIREQLGGTAILLPLQQLHDDDLSVLRPIAEAGAGAVLATPIPSPSDLVAAIAKLDLVVGMRLHSLVLALAAGTPSVALSYDPKVEEFARAAGLGEHVHSLDDLDPDMILASCRSLLESREELRGRLAEKRDHLRQSAALSAELARELLESGQVRHRPSPASARKAKPPQEMRVLMQIRPDYLGAPGGDTVQMSETVHHLRAFGVGVDLTTEESPDLSAYDLVHVFNLGRPREPYRHCLNAVQQGKPIALSTVYWDFEEFWQWGDPDYWELPSPQQGLPQPRPAPPPDPIEARHRALLDQQRLAALEWATVFLPNGEGEAQLLAEVYGMDLGRSLVVPNGVAELFFEARPELFVDKHGLRDFVLCAARVEKRKNQLCLVAAMRGTGIPLVIVGQANPEGYRDLCRRYADDSVVFLDALPQEELASAYAAAKVHALVGWFETPGLSTLEAAAAGCNIVSTDRGLAQEYLSDMAWYCDPRRVDSIRRAVMAAYEAPRSEALRERMRAHYTWRQAAERTLEGYRLALALHDAQSTPARQQAALEAMRRHADFVARLASDREYEALRTRQWGEAVEAELKRLQQEFARVTSRRLHRWSAALARAGWSILRAFGVKP